MICLERALIEIERGCVGFASRELRVRAAPAHLADLHKYLEMKTAGESRPSVEC